MLVCFVPWARELPKPKKNLNSKRQPSPAYLAAREGLKADNKICKIVDAATHHLQEVIDLKDSIGPKQESNEVNHKQVAAIDRAIHGQAIRRWGSEWRSVVIFALLTEAMELGVRSRFDFLPVCQKEKLIITRDQYIIRGVRPLDICSGLP